MKTNEPGDLASVNTRDLVPEGVGGFLAKVTAGMGIEELLIEDIRNQRQAGRAVRNAQLNRQRKLIFKAVDKMKKAADSRVNSAILSAFVQVGTSVLNCITGGFIEDALGKMAANSIGAGAQALSSGLCKLNFYEQDAVEKDGKAKILQHVAGEAAQQANDTRDWIQSARQLESKMIDHVQKVSDSESKSRMDLLRSIG